MATMTHTHTDAAGREFHAQRDDAKHGNAPWIVNFSEGAFNFHGTKAELQRRINKVSAELAKSDAEADAE